MLPPYTTSPPIWRSLRVCRVHRYTLHCWTVFSTQITHCIFAYLEVTALWPLTHSRYQVLCTELCDLEHIYSVKHAWKRVVLKTQTSTQAASSSNNMTFIFHTSTISFSFWIIRSVTLLFDDTLVCNRSCLAQGVGCWKKMLPSCNHKYFFKTFVKLTCQIRWMTF